MAFSYTFNTIYTHVCVHTTIKLLTYFIGPSEDAPTLVDNTTSAEVKRSLIALCSKIL